MKKVDFDEYSGDYDVLMQEQHKKFGDISYYSEYKVNILKSYFDVNKTFKILEYGCGIGKNIKYLEKIFINSEIYGFDISNESLNRAKNDNPNMILLLENEFKLYYKKFDIIFIAGVFHHIEPSLRDSVVSNIYKLLNSNGKIIIFEHNPYNPLTRHMVNTCEFDKDAVLLSKKKMMNLFKKSNLTHEVSKYTLFVPPKLKKLNFIEKFIGWIPLGGQYYSMFKKLK